jgi:hypothetical protein
MRGLAFTLFGWASLAVGASAAKSAKVESEKDFEVVDELSMRHNADMAKADVVKRILPSNAAGLIQVDTSNLPKDANRNHLQKEISNILNRKLDASADE